MVISGVVSAWQHLPLAKEGGETANCTSFVFLQQWAIADPCARLLAGESYQVGQAFEVFQCYLPATSTQSHGEGSTGGKGVMLLFNECLQCFLMQAFPSSMST